MLPYAPMDIRYLRLSSSLAMLSIPSRLTTHDLQKMLLIVVFLKEQFKVQLWQSAFFNPLRALAA
jgi:hypothetical protein